MKVLIAEDDAMMCHILRYSLSAWGYDVVAVSEGETALRLLQADEGFGMAILDWLMPGLEGPEVCRQLRAGFPHGSTYLILLTTRDLKADLVTGLQSGANDYVTKPFDPGELQARVAVGRTVVELRHTLAARVRELESALAQVKQLRGLLPICMYCKKVRDGQEYWEQLEAYISKNTDAQFSHGICPECWKSEVALHFPETGKYPEPETGAT